MEIDDRLAKLEAKMAEGEKIDQPERTGLRIAKFVLLVIALAAPVMWALFEFVLFLINRFETLRHALSLSFL